MGGGNDRQAHSRVHQQTIVSSLEGRGDALSICLTGWCSSELAFKCLAVKMRFSSAAYGKQQQAP